MTHFVLDCPPIIVPGKDAEMVYNSVVHYIDDLTSMRHWISNRVDKPTEAESKAMANIAEEIAHFRAFQLRLYEECIGPGQVRPRIAYPDSESHP